MKGIKTNLIQKTLQFKYKVELFNGNEFSFPNIKQAKSFEVAANRYYSELLYKLNERYSNIYKKYREMWHYLSHEQNRQIKYLTSSIEQLLDEAATRGNFDNKFTHTFLSKIIKQLAEVSYYLLTIVKSKSDTFNIYFYNLLIEDLRTLYNSLFSFGNDSEFIINYIKHESIIFDFEDKELNRIFYSNSPTQSTKKQSKKII